MFVSVHIEDTLFAFSDRIVKKISSGVLTVKPMKVWLTFLISAQLHLLCIGVIESNIPPKVLIGADFLAFPWKNIAKEIKV